MECEVEVGYLCGICGERFNHWLIFKIHKMIHTNSNLPSLFGRSNNESDQQTDTNPNINRPSVIVTNPTHMTHNKQIGVSSGISSEGSGITFDQEKELLCEVCGQLFYNNVPLKRHLQTHTNNALPLENIQDTRDKQTAQTRLDTNRASVVVRNPYVNNTAAEREQDTLKIDQVRQALGNSSIRHYRIDNRNRMRLEEFLQKTTLLLLNILQHERTRLNVVKFGIVLDTIFTNVENAISPRSFISRNRSVLETDDLHTIIEECLQELILKVTEHEGRGSGYTLLHSEGVTIRIHRQGYGHRGARFIPLPPKIAATHSCVNVKNFDIYCFKHAMLSKYITGAHPERLNIRYRQIENRYNFDGLKFPLAVTSLKTFLRNNPGVSVNIFGLDNGCNVFPISVMRELNRHTDLLLLKNKQGQSHYVYVKNFNKLIVRQLTKSKNGIVVCKRCLSFTTSIHDGNRNAGAQWLIEHIRLCGEHKEARVLMPKQARSTIKFTQYSHQIMVTFVIYADFESTLLGIEGPRQEDNQPYTHKYQFHEPNSFCLFVKSTLSDNFLSTYNIPLTPIVYRGNNVANVFMRELQEIAKKVEIIYNLNVPMLDMTVEEVDEYNNATNCYMCGDSFTLDNKKVRDHSHMSGLYRGAAHNNCNMNYKEPRFIPVVLHNLSKYDAHFIVPALGSIPGKIDVIANSTETFVSFSKKINTIKLKFVDSLRFLSASLQTLAGLLSKEDFVETKKTIPEDKLDLCLRKASYCYDYINSLDKFDEEQLPGREHFYNKLNEEHLSEEDYMHAQRIWTEFNMKNLGDYSNFYVRLDVTLLADVMERFRKTCMKAYGIDVLHSITAAGLAWIIMLKQTKCELQLITDVSMHNMVQAGIRGGITQCVKRHSIANNPYMPNYDPNEDRKYLIYLDVNNLYGWASISPLPYSDFKWINPEDLPNISNIPLEGERGFVIECDVSYPERYHDLHFDFPLLPESDIPPEGKFSKLMCTMKDKKYYVAHYWILQQAIQLGLIITKVHRVISFSQSCWLKPYIQANTIRRQAATSDFEKDLYKLLNNAVFGKFLQNKRKYLNCKIITSERELTKLSGKSHFNTSIIINDKVAIVSMHKTKVVLDKPIIIGMSILEISKTLMYKFHYQDMVEHFGRSNIVMCYCDTDAGVFEVKCRDVYEELRTCDFKDIFDFSDYPPDHKNYDNGKNKKVLGKIKDETNGIPIVELVALRPKMYALKLISNNHRPESLRCGEKDVPEVIKKAKGIKKSYLCKHMAFEDYKQCLLNNTKYMANFNAIRSFNHQLFTITQNKKSLSSNDDKRKILNDGINTLPHGHYSLRDITD